VIFGKKWEVFTMAFALRRCWSPQLILILLIDMLVLVRFSAPVLAQNPIKQPAPGAFPIKITAPGSYILETNLTGAPTDAIDIQANYVSLDLNGFAIIGTGSGDGVNASGRTGVAIRKGSVTNFLTGLNAGQSGVVQNVRAQGNSGDGIDCGSDCVISGNIANANGGNGILVSGSNNLISDNTANGNKGAGIFLNSGSHHRVSGNTVNDNGTGANCWSGITAPQIGTPLTSPVTDCDVSWNTANHNCGSGINGGPGWKVSHNVTNDNGYKGVIGTRGNGISLAGNDDIIDGNVANRNGGNGLAGNPGNGYLVTNNEASNNQACGLFLRPGIGSGFSNNVFLYNTENTGNPLSPQLCGYPSFKGTSLGDGMTNLCNGTRC